MNKKELAVLQSRVFELECAQKKQDSLIKHGTCRFWHNWSRWKFKQTVDIYDPTYNFIIREKEKLVSTCLDCGKEREKLI